MSAKSPMFQSKARCDATAIGVWTYTDDADDQDAKCKDEKYVPPSRVDGKIRRLTFVVPIECILNIQNWTLFPLVLHGV